VKEEQASKQAGGTKKEGSVDQSIKSINQVPGVSAQV